MTTSFIIGDLLTGRRIQTLNVTTGSWTDTLNAAGNVSCEVSLRDPVNRGLGLFSSAAVGKSFLAAVDGNTILQAGPIWAHDYDRDSQSLKLTAAGMWSYFDHRVLLPILAGRLPTDPTTNSSYTTSYQGMVRNLVAQAQTASNGNVPVILPAEITGTFVRNYLGSDLGFVGGRISELTQLQGGPDVKFSPQFTSDMLGVQWALLVGTPTQPLLFSPLDVVFKPTAALTSISALKVNADGTSLASRAFGAGGRTADVVVETVSIDTTLLNAGYPLLEAVDSSHATVSDTATMQKYSDELVLRGKVPIQTWSFTHDASLAAPLIGTFSSGDFGKTRVHGDPYIPDGEYRLRITQISGNEIGRKLDITFQPQVN
ncbi:MAG: hypothetical protein ABIP33_06495 [Pseudolysinimonas sp.]